jgi:DnaJ-domain-containing protein 1
VQPDLLPAPGKTITILDWQDALRALTDGWIYTFTAEQQVQQVHFQPTTLADQYIIWHFADFQVEHVSVRRREIHHGPVKGDWFLGDIASPAYKRRINYERVNQRYHYNTQSRPHTPHTVLPTDQLNRYYALLNLPLTASEKEVKSAFRQLAMNVHPDVSALPREIAEQRIKELLEAYDFIKAHHGWH